MHTKTMTAAMQDDRPTHYDQDYFAWQAPSGRFGGQAELIKFQDFVGPEDRVVDFGCGGGFVLAALRCRERLGVEINPAAQGHCRRLGLSVHADLAEVPDGWADVVISNHALEHTHAPLQEIRKVLMKLKPGGRAVFVVPCERHDVAFRPGDINQHLYTWSPLNLGNLFACAGFEVVECREFVHRWPPKWDLIAARLGWTMFHRVARLHGWLRRDQSQVRIVARKPSQASTACDMT
jgi:SAM-dependent methyltransferase